jgi:phosphate transport system permease protein
VVVEDATGLTYDVKAVEPLPSLLLSERATRMRRMAGLVGHGALLLVTSSSVLAVLFIFFFIARDAIPFFQLRGVREFLGSTAWYPTGGPASFGALAIFFGTAIVTTGAVLVAVPLGVTAAICLSDILPFSVRQVVKPIIEVLAAIPSVAYGFFALVVLAPLLQEQGGHLLAVGAWAVGTPCATLGVIVASELVARRSAPGRQLVARVVALGVLGALSLWLLFGVTAFLGSLVVASGTNALNVSIILGLMALPTVVSVSEDALQAVGRELREGSYALGATRAETMIRVVLPAASSGICAAVILGIMRAVGETMVVWMASGNAAQVPSPWFNVLEPVRTLTATIAGDMGEADQVSGAARYHVLFAMALCLLAISFALNMASEWAVRRTRRKMQGG